MRKLGILLVLPIVGALLAVSGAVASSGYAAADGKATAAAGITPAIAQPAPSVTAFCDAELSVDKAASKVFGTGKPKQKDVQALDAALAQAQSAAPPELAAALQVIVEGARSAAQSGKDPTTDAAFQRNLNVIYEYRFNSCGYQTAEVTTIEYEFQGLPKTVKPGPLAIKLTDSGTELHELAGFRLKTKDSVKKVLGLPNKEQKKKVENAGGTIVLPGETTYVIADLSKPGRYGVACFLPVGSTSAQEAEKKSHEHGGGTPHWKKGMFATITSQNA